MNRRFASLSFVLLLLTAACGGGGGSTPSVNPTATPTTTPTQGPATAYTCPSSDGASAVAVSSSLSSEAVRRAGPRRAPAATNQPGLLAVTYDADSFQGRRAQLVAREATFGATVQREFVFTHTKLVTRIVAVTPSRMAAVAAALRLEPGVKSVGVTGGVRYPLAVTTPFFTNDPYFPGFTPSVAPYYETATVPGQWDMHAIKLEDAFGYSQSGNGSGITNARALGAASVKIAVIDTGADSLHPKLKGKVAYQRCFITKNQGGLATQSTSNFSTDPQGHGTDTSGLATEAINSGLGFAGAGGNSVLYSYRVFPTPDDTCASPGASDTQCTSTSTDIASALQDAVAQHVNVISLSLGGGLCTNGVDPDPVEGNAIAEAIATNIVVVASSGNGGSAGVTAPACDTGVIAAGASALADGQPNGSGFTRGTTAAPVEYVTSYSQYGSPAAAVHNASAWGIVAPGGDPSSDSDQDNLHWIQNIWTTTPLDKNFAGSCIPDYPGTNPTIDCQILIAGTSMSSPIVAGAAGLILAVNPSYQSPTKMKQLLCSTADDIRASREGCGRLNVYRAMALALGDPNPP